MEPSTGGASNATLRNGFVARYLPSGELDSGFATAGLLTVAASANDEDIIRALVVQPMANWSLLVMRLSVA